MALNKNTSKYVIGVKRHALDDVPQDWIEQLEAIDGLTLLSSPGSKRLLVTAEAHAIETAQNLLGVYLHIEPIIQHNRVN